MRNPVGAGRRRARVLVSRVVAVWWRGPNWHDVYHAFDFVTWRWIVAAIALNLRLRPRARLLVAAHDRAGSAGPAAVLRHVFSAFGVGLLGNAVLPARAGELARVAVLRRHLDHGPGTSATLLGTVFAHRLFDLFPALLLVVWVLSRPRSRTGR